MFQYYRMASNAYYIGSANLLYGQDLDWTVLTGCVDGEYNIIYKDDGLLSEATQQAPNLFEMSYMYNLPEGTNHIEETANVEQTTYLLDHILEHRLSIPRLP